MNTSLRKDVEKILSIKISKKEKVSSVKIYRSQGGQVAFNRPLDPLRLITEMLTLFGRNDATKKLDGKFGVSKVDTLHQFETLQATTWLSRL